MTRDEFSKEFIKLAPGYHPAPEVIKHIGEVTLCMLIGPSGVGKTTLIQHSGLHFVPSDTTREQRTGEKDGVDMYFRRDYDQVIDDIKTGRFVQIAPFATGDLYATKDTSYPTSGVAIMPVMANVIPIFRELGFKRTISAFTTPPSFQEWMRRLGTHPESEELRNKRLTEGRRSLQFALSDDEIHFILNDEIEAAVRQLKDLVNDKIDYQLEEKARKIAQSLLAALS